MFFTIFWVSVVHFLPLNPLMGSSQLRSIHFQGSAGDGTVVEKTIQKIEYPPLESIARIIMQPK